MKVRLHFSPYRTACDLWLVVLAFLATSHIISIAAHVSYRQLLINCVSIAVWLMIGPIIRQYRP